MGKLLASIVLSELEATQQASTFVDTTTNKLGIESYL